MESETADEVAVDESTQQSELPSSAPPSSSSQCESNSSEEPPPKKFKFALDVSHTDEGRTCPICLKYWTNAGDHRICSLKCGHLFGLSCILHWFLVVNSGVNKYCPTCKEESWLYDIRYIYACKLVAQDTTELETLKSQIKDSQEETNAVKNQLSQIIFRECSAVQEIKDLTLKIAASESELFRLRGSVQCVHENVILEKEASLLIGKNGGCRVIDYKENNFIAVSTKSTTSIFGGYGVRKLNFNTCRPTTFIPIHTKAIRDIRVHNHNQWILSVSLDKSVKIVDAQLNNQISYYSGESPFWSCCWDCSNPNVLYAGEQMGSVVKLDTRYMKQPICKLSIPGDNSPVVAVSSTKPQTGGAFGVDGIVCCKLNSLWAFEKVCEEYTANPIPIEGPFTSMSYYDTTDHLYISTRSNAHFQHNRHILCTIEKRDEQLQCNIIHSFVGGLNQKCLTRPALVTHKNHYAAAYVESSKSVYLWSINSGERVCSIPAHEPVLDLRGLQRTFNNYLFTLNERTLEVYKFVS